MVRFIPPLATEQSKLGCNFDTTMINNSDMKRVILIYGGRSGEHEISLRSAHYIYANLLEGGYTPVPVGITPRGDWFFQKEMIPGEEALPLNEDEGYRLSFLPNKGLVLPDQSPLEGDIVFPVLHGPLGEDGTIQGLFEILDMPYVGAGVESSALAMDKITAKRIWMSRGLPVVPFRSLEYSRWMSADFEGEAFIDTLLDELGCPLFIKPSRAGSSVGVSRGETRDEIRSALDRAFLYDRSVLIEKSVKAREIECSLLGTDQPRVFGPGEITPHHGFYDYDAKYIDPEGAALLIPAPLDGPLRQKVRDTALSAYKALGIEGLSRVDFFLEEGNIFINEINTMPGFTRISMFPMLCSHEGLKGPALMEELIRYGFEAHGARKRLRRTR